MQEMNQGEEYEELGFEDEEVDYSEESAEDTKSGINFIYGIPKNKFLIGLTIAGVIILFIVLFATKKSGDTATEDIVYPESTPVTDVEPQATYTDCYDAAGVFLGRCDKITDGFSIYTDTGSVVGFIDSTGTEVFYDAQGIVLGNYSSSVLTDVTTETPTDTNSDDVVLLRKMGYTGDEIETALAMGTPVDTLVEEAQKLRDEEAKEALVRMSDSASEEFQYILNNSVFCLPELQFDAFDPEVSSARKYDGSFIVNADYAKVPTYGNQLLIKVKIANNTYAYHCVTPDRWETLPDTGNIVMQVNYTMHGTNFVNMYITSMSEVDSTHITVNPEDSASELSDILSDNSAQYIEDLEVEESTEESSDNWW